MFLENFVELQSRTKDMRDHILTLYAITVGMRAKVIVEIGVRHGISTLALLGAAKETNGIVYSVDVDPCKQAQDRVRNFKLRDYWRFHQMDSVKFLDRWTADLIDVAFVDGDHTFPGVERDMRAVYPLIRENGIIMMHDAFCHPAVAEREGIEVGRFVDQMELDPIFAGMEKVTLPYNNGLTIVRKLK